MSKTDKYTFICSNRKIKINEKDPSLLSVTGEYESNIKITLEEGEATAWFLSPKGYPVELRIAASGMYNLDELKPVLRFLRGEEMDFFSMPTNAFRDYCSSQIFFMHDSYSLPLPETLIPKMQDYFLTDYLGHQAPLDISDGILHFSKEKHGHSVTWLLKSPSDANYFVRIQFCHASQEMMETIGNAYANIKNRENSTEILASFIASFTNTSRSVLNTASLILNL